MTITAKVIEYSVGPSDQHKPILTIEARYPRFIHAELMTHRVFSRNAASSRAIPTSKLIDDVLLDPAMPTYWGKNQPGMQAKEECNEKIDLYSFGTNAEYPEAYDTYEIWSRDLNSHTREDAWLYGRDQMVSLAKAYNTAGYHKQIVNRLLEPWAHITVCITSTSWANFFALRDHPDAQPEIRVLAQEIKKAKDAATPKRLQYGEWHLPYVTEEERSTYSLEDQKALSVARCASTSYKTVDGKIMTVEKALDLYQKLMGNNPVHASPTEHQATPDGPSALGGQWPNLHGNLKGYIQYRKTISGEYVHD